nr:Chain A, FERREDOXIN CHLOROPLASTIC TRANSIT PEPTIDE SEQUENCE FROM THE GREEN ALGA [Chlamydomonas reinhardtii]
MAMAMRSTFAARVGAKPAVRGARPASRMSCMA